MDKFYVIGDTHGRLDMLIRSLKDWNSENEQLVLLGDYVDYGPDSFSLIREVKNLVDKYGAVALKGNHEYHLSEMLLRPNTVKNIENEWYAYGRIDTFRSFLGLKEIEKNNFKEYRKEIINRHFKYIEFMDELPLYLESDSFIFAHAGINLFEQNWKLDEMSMIEGDRDDFLKTRNQTNKIIVFGHTRTGIIRGLKNGANIEHLHRMPFLDDRIWIDETGTKLGIDGGNVFGGYLHAVHLDEYSDKIITTSVGQDLLLSNQEFFINEEFNRLVI